MSSFKNKHVLITGGASGIGLLMGKRALERGAQTFVIWDISKENINGALNQLSDYEDRIITQKVDVSNADNIYKSAEQLMQQIPRVDILINNAGIIVGKEFSDQSPDEIHQTIAINQLGVMHTTRAFLPEMQSNNGGHIVNIASAAGLIANPGMSVYVGSKWAIIGWSESLRIELEQTYSNIRVTTIEPSYIDTGMFENVSPPLLTPLLQPDEIADKIISSVEKNKIHLRSPFIVKLLPFLKGVFPTRVFDFVIGKIFRVYHSMDSFTGRTVEKELD
jgi:short-subunit dehydrogenase